MYFLNFVEEYWNVKPKYQDWRVGRVEIFKDDEQWAINELRFSTPPTKESEKNGNKPPEFSGKVGNFGASFKKKEVIDPEKDLGGT